MITKAKFIGKNGSLGFVKGATYYLQFLTVNQKINIQPIGNSQGQTCLYDSLKLSKRFGDFENWYKVFKLTPEFNEFWDLNFNYQRDIYELLLIFNKK